MTHEEIDQLPAGRELDRLIAIRIFGCLPKSAGVDRGIEFWQCGCWPHIHANKYGFIEEYSRKIEAAWLVFEVVSKSEITKAREDKFQLLFRPGGWEKNPGPFFVGFYRQEDFRFEEGKENKWPWGYGDSAPLAICRAALKTTIGDSNES